MSINVCLFTVIDARDLTPREANALRDDVLGLAEELDCGFPSAERTLLRRIGGQDNLRSYVDCLMVGR